MKKQKMYVTVIFFLLLLILVMFYFDKVKLPAKLREKEAEYLTNARMTLVIKKGHNMTQSSKVSQEDYDLKFEVKPVPIAYLPGTEIAEGYNPGVPNSRVIDQKYLSMDELGKNNYAAQVKAQIAPLVIGKFTTEELSSGEVVLDSTLVGEDKQWKNNREKLREYELSNDLAGTLSEGDIIDVILDLKNGDYEVVASHKRIQNLIKPNENQANQENMGKVKIILAVNETEYRNLEMAKKISTLAARKYINAEQPASKVTFNYELARVFARETINTLIAKSFGNEESVLSSFNNSKYNEKKFVQWFNEKEINPTPYVYVAPVQPTEPAQTTAPTTNTNNGYPSQNGSL